MFQFVIIWTKRFGVNIFSQKHAFTHIWTGTVLANPDVPCLFQIRGFTEIAFQGNIQAIEHVAHQSSAQPGDLIFVAPAQDIDIVTNTNHDTEKDDGGRNTQVHQCLRVYVVEEEHRYTISVKVPLYYETQGYGQLTKCGKTWPKSNRYMCEKPVVAEKESLFAGRIISGRFRRNRWI
jgi:hypothetical protein